MLNAVDIARYFLAIQDEEAGELITPLKLQKLVYYAQGFHLALFDAPLFREQIKAWEHGPVVPALWHEYKDQGPTPVPVPVDVDLTTYDASTRELLDEVYSVYGQYSAWRLRELTHDELPWIEGWNSPGKVIRRDTMRSFFKGRLSTS